MKRKPDHERAAAARRLAREQLFSLRELTGVAGCSPQALLRWAVEGRSGVFLDAVRHPEKGWLSSEEAVRRFFAALAARKGGVR